MTLERLSHSGTAVSTVLASSITSSASAFTVAPGTGINYPTGGGVSPFTSEPFVVSLDATTNAGSLEKILCSTRSGDTFTVAAGGRGWDGTTATSHSSGASVQHVISAAEVDDTSDHIYNTIRNDHTQYAQLSGATFTGAVYTNDGLTVTGGVGVSGLIGVSGIATFGQKVTATDFVATGLTGATSGTRFAGATTSGSPASGTFLVGDFVVDQTGTIWICTTGGTPGTWVAVGTNQWTSYTPTVTQGISLTSTVSYCKYFQQGTLVHVVCQLDITSAGTSGDAIWVSTPSGLAPNSAIAPYGPPVGMMSTYSPPGITTPLMGKTVIYGGYGFGFVQIGQGALLGEDGYNPPSGGNTYLGFEATYET